MKTIFACSMFFLGVTASSQPWLLYDTGNPRGRYLLSGGYEEPPDCRVFEIIICDSIAVETIQPLCRITMSNASVYVTKVRQGCSLQEPGAVAQRKMFAERVTRDFLGATKVVFNNTVVNLSDLKLPMRTEHQSRDDQTGAVKEKLRRPGFEPPADVGRSRRRQEGAVGRR